MGRPAALSRETIVVAATALVEKRGADALSARRLGEALSCDPTALYRHYANMDDLRRDVGDRLLAAVRVDARNGEPWDKVVLRICVELRSAQLRQPRLAALVHAAPTRLVNELRITDALLRELLRGGFTPEAAARAYHSLVELTVGSAAIDATLAGETAVARRREYRAWRHAYATLDIEHYPNAVAVSGHLYDGTADQRFERALAAMLDGLASRRAG